MLLGGLKYGLATSSVDGAHHQSRVKRVLERFKTLNPVAFWDIDVPSRRILPVLPFARHRVARPSIQILWSACTCSAARLMEFGVNAGGKEGRREGGKEDTQKMTRLLLLSLSEARDPFPRGKTSYTSVYLPRAKHSTLPW
jgi:hypothetical protein